MNISVFVVSCGFLLAPPTDAQASNPQSARWETPAEWHRSLKKAVPGLLLVDEGGVEFRSAKFNQRWPYTEIPSFDLALRELTLLSYQNRAWHEPGERRFHFTLSEPMPPEIAAQFTARVGRTVRNGAPIPNAGAIAEIPAHHRLWSGGSNGALRFKEEGIDYVTEDGRDSHSWRWDDIQTIANPNPYEFRVTAFRETLEFDLKHPFARGLFERVWDRLYASGLNLSAAAGHEAHP